MDPTVAVTFSIYGNFDLNRLKFSIMSLSRQDYSPLELIVSEQNDFPKFEKESKKLGIKYIFSKNPQGEEVIYNPGKIRNQALNEVTSEYVYTNDSDIVFMYPNYLKKLVNLMESDKNLILQKPPMRRLLLNSFDSFKDGVDKEGMENTLNNLIFPNYYVATSNKNENAALVVRTNSDGRTYTIKASDFLEYLSNEDLKGLEPTVWFDIVHPGGIFARSSQIKSVEGYCEEYRTWGQEDYDLQWKLGELYNLQDISDNEEFRVLHFDHKKNYFSKRNHLNNQEIYFKRMNQGIKRVIEFDKKNTYKNEK